MFKKINSFWSDWNYTKKKKFEKVKELVPLAICKGCLSFYYDDSWHEDRPKHLSLYYQEEIPIFFTHCYSCLEYEEILYEKKSELIFG